MHLFHRDEAMDVKTVSNFASSGGSREWDGRMGWRCFTKVNKVVECKCVLHICYIED